MLWPVALLGIGVAIGAANDPPGMFHGIATGFGGIVGIVSGALIGGIIGSQITGYEDYELNQKNNKRAEFERILKIDKKLNVNNVSY